MQPASDSSSPQLSAPLGEKSTVMDVEKPLINIIHLDCGTGGDCTVLYTATQFVVIDGGKGNTGKRLTSLLNLLIQQGLKPLAFIVSHFDLDHYYGLFQAIGTLSEHHSSLKSFIVMSPADATIVNTKTPAPPNQWEKGSRVFGLCNDLRKRASKSDVKIHFKAPETLEFTGGMQLELMSLTTQRSPTACDENNGSSLQWILSDSENRTSTTYYTGGDSQVGPLTATIVKLDHHGSTKDHTNANTNALENALYWVIMGAGHSYDHPGDALLESVEEKNPWIFMTQHHFDDDFLKYKRLHVGRAAAKWGDIGFSLFKNQKILINTNIEKHLLSNNDAQAFVPATLSSQLDEKMYTLLASTRNILGCPNDRLYGRKEVVHKVDALSCIECGEPAKRVPVSEDSNDLITCAIHEKMLMKRLQAQLKKKRKKEKKETEEVYKPRKTRRFVPPPDKTDIETEEDNNIFIGTDTTKKVKTEATSTSPAQDIVD
ncbi:hypothetical protein [Pseudomonas putida]|uniref:Metallo-beta-lactamase domain-containing protein n=1 Tax=Pseudomonas putida TaxID=303 RepID=A0A1Q9QVI7_PSEPU|nr:hypothetical protein [Pseudomonas putida]OLS59166.1 hypothetical protein PSEMO_61270 [Pseudomonas putida]